MSRGFLFLVILLALGSCAKDKPAAKAAKLTPPTDEATSEQRTQIDEMLTRIEGLTSELGHARSFRSLPIVVTTDERTYTDHPAACVSAGGEGQFILIKPTVFENEAGLRDGGVESTLFRVLLHEIGHCYFNRQHEEARLFEDGKSIEISMPEGAVYQYAMLDASVMVPEELSVPIALEKYYVAEILGVARAAKPADFGAYAKVRMVRSPDNLSRP